MANLLNLPRDTSVDGLKLKVTSLLKIFILSTVICIGNAVHILKESSNHEVRKDFLSLGRASSNHVHQVIFSVKQRNLDLIEQKLYDVSTPSSKNYGKYLTFEQVGKLVENKDATETVMNWLTENDVNIIKKTKFGEYITCEAPIDKWENLFQTTFYEYRKTENSNSLFLQQNTIRAKSYSLPDYIAGHVETVLNIVTLPPQTSTSTSKRNKKLLKNENEIKKTNDNLNENKNKNNLRHSRQLVNNFGLPSTFLTPSSLRNILNVTMSGSNLGSITLYESIGQTFSLKDLSLFQSYFQLPQQGISNVFGPLPDGDLICYTSEFVNYCGEGSVDIQYVTSIASNVPVSVWYETASDAMLTNFILALASNVNPAGIYSISYGAYESDVGVGATVTFNNEAMKLGLRGVTLIAAAGDSGISGFKFNTAPTPIQGCGYYAQWPASSPYVTAVGSTMNGPTISGTPEEVATSLNTVSYTTSGGGFSGWIPAPAFQKQAIKNYFSQYKAPQSSVQAYNSSNRGYPDISLPSNQYVIFEGGNMYSVDGSSASTPAFAGLVGLINSFRLQYNLSTVGWLNPAIYANNGGFTNDVVTGENNCTGSGTANHCCPIGFAAKKGWDPATGFGSVDFHRFFSYFLPNVTSFAPTANPTQAPVPTLTPTRKPTTASPTSYIPTIYPTPVPVMLHPTQYPSSPPFNPTFKPTKAPVVKTSKPVA